MTLEISHEGVDLVALPECSFDVRPHDPLFWTPKLILRECSLSGGVFLYLPNQHKCYPLNQLTLVLADTRPPRRVPSASPLQDLFMV